MTVEFERIGLKKVPGVNGEFFAPFCPGWLVRGKCWWEARAAVVEFSVISRFSLVKYEQGPLNAFEAAENAQHRLVMCITSGQSGIHVSGIKL